MTVEVRILESRDAQVLAAIAPDVFDNPIDACATAEFLADSRHHLAVAIEQGVVVGFASAVVYVHPDKRRPELWINEVAVAPSHRRRGVGGDLVRRVLERGREADCTEAWVLTHRSNDSAMRLYSSLGGREARDDQVMFTFRLDPDVRDGHEASRGAPDAD